jgi:hypothetical protein
MHRRNANSEQLTFCTFSLERYICATPLNEYSTVGCKTDRVNIFIKAVVFCPSCSIGRGRRGGSLQSGLLGSAGPGASLSRGQRTSNRIKFLPGTVAQGASQGTGPGTGLPGPGCCLKDAATARPRGGGGTYGHSSPRQLSTKLKTAAAARSKHFRPVDSSRGN